MGAALTLSLAWVTPFGAASDVGAFSRNLLAEFVRDTAALGVAVTVFVNANGESFWTQLPTVRLTGTDQDREILASFDCVVFNVGNNQENHGHINRLAVQVPGVVVVHDLIMQHYFAWEIFDRTRRPDLYARLIGEYYGADGLEMVGRSQICCDAAATVYAPWDSQHVVQMPLIEPFVQAGAAVVVHSRFAAEAVRRMTDAPLLLLRLPWDQKSFESDESLEQWAANTRSAESCLVVCFGHIARNKNLDQVVQAFGDSRMLRTRARLVVAGYAGDRGYAEQLREQVADLGLGQIVSFAFDIPDDVLGRLKHDADIFVNLRYPNTESASGSVVEQLNTGKPVLVYPTGSYAEIPDGAAIRVERQDGVGGLVEALERALLDPELRVRVGAAGRRHVRQVGRAEYVAALCRFLHGNLALLRARKACSVGRRGLATGIDRAVVGAGWLDQVARTRRLFDSLAQPRHQLDVAPFAGWDDVALRRFISLGLFGQSLDSPFEWALRRLMQRTGATGQGRHELHRIVGLAHLLWFASRGEDDAGLLRTCLAQPVLVFAVYQLLAGLDAASFIRCSYLGLLRRHADPEGARYLEASAASMSFGGVLRGLLDSTEFAEAGVSADALRAFRLACDAVPAPGLDYPALAFGATVEISSGNPECGRYLLAGWHDVEELGVWARTARGVVLFRPAEAPGGNATLSVTGRMPGVGLKGPRPLRVQVNAAPPQEFTFADEDWATLTLELPEVDPDGGGYLVDFDVGEVVNLQNLGLAEESRDLGFRLGALLLARHPAA